jgi:hypothetical protein
MTLDCAANFANVTVCNILDDWHEAGDGTELENDPRLLHFWLCGVAEEAV